MPSDSADIKSGNSSHAEEKHEIPETLLQHAYQCYVYTCLLTNKYLQTRSIKKEKDDLA